MPRSPQQIEEMYENLKKTDGTNALNRNNVGPYSLLMGMYSGMLSTNRALGKLFKPYQEALITLHTYDPSKVGNRDKLAGALTTLDSFGDFLNGNTEDIENIEGLN